MFHVRFNFTLQHKANDEAVRREQTAKEAANCAKEAAREVVKVSKGVEAKGLKSALKASGDESVYDGIDDKVLSSERCGTAAVVISPTAPSLTVPSQ